MYHYTISQWMFFFYFYCFFGWCFESTYVSINKKKFVNRGFIRGPFLPLYGSGAVMMLVVSSPMQGNWLLIYIAGCVGATALEYITGVVMEALFKVRYWDYSHKKLNFQGHICLESTLCWGALTVLVTQFVHKPIENLAFWIPARILLLIVALISVYFVADFVISFQAALDLRDVLVKAEQARQELERMQKRLDVLIAVVNEEREEKKRERALKREELISGIEEAFAQLRDALPASDVLHSKKEELLELRDRFVGNRQVGKEKEDSFLHNIVRRAMLKGNPDMSSRKFYDALEELKQSAQNYRKNGKNKTEKAVSNVLSDDEEESAEEDLERVNEK